MPTCSEALSFYFDALVVMTTVAGALSFLSILLFIIMHYMAKKHAHFRSHALEALSEAGYFYE